MVYPSYNIRILNNHLIGYGNAQIDTYGEYASVTGAHHLVIKDNLIEGAGTGYCIHMYAGDTELVDNVVTDCDRILTGTDAGWHAGFGAIEFYCTENHAGAFDDINISGNQFLDVVQGIKHVPTSGCQGEFGNINVSDNIFRGRLAMAIGMADSSEDSTTENTTIGLI